MIRIRDVAKRYGAVQALQEVGFDVARGETLGVIGPNGAGKTTLLKVLLGLVRADTGTVAVDGTDLADDPVGLRRRIGYVPQYDGFEERSTGREALGFLARLRGVPTAEVEVHAGTVGVAAQLDRPVGVLSGGQRQRLSVAAALLGDPPVLLLDEPTASLDPRATASFRKLVGRMAAEGRTVMLCSHLLDDVERLCDRVLMLLDGRVAGIEVMDRTRTGAAAGRGDLEERFLAAVGEEEADDED
jgi:ABC-type multidrug transport system ATPase subunit